MKSIASLAPVARALFIVSQGIQNDNISLRNSCLTSNYFGAYSGQSVFILEHGCAAEIQAVLKFGTAIEGLFDAGSGRELVWMQEKAVALEMSSKDVEPSSFAKQLDGLMQALAESNEVVNHQRLSQPNDQGVFQAAAEESIQLLYHTETAALLSVPRSALQVLDAHIPRFWFPSALPTRPLPFGDPPHVNGALDRVKNVLSSLEFNPDIAAIVHDLNVVEMGDTVRWLTGEDPESPIISRHSFHPDAYVAAEWIKRNMEATGASCSLVPFLEGFVPNIVCSYLASVQTSEIVLLAAHYDSHGSFGSLRAPGGNDDASGTTAILHIAKTIGRKNVKFHANVQLVLFAGEEQGLYGSRAYAAEMQEQNANLTLMIQSDMLAYHSPDEPPQLGLPTIVGTPEVSQLVANVSALYSPELTVGYASTCPSLNVSCSDQQSFLERGFPATQVFERIGPILDPMYHNSGDVSDRPGYDLHQVRSIAKVTFAALLHTAGFSIPENERA